MPNPPCSTAPLLRMLCGVVAAVLLAGCSELETIREAITPPTPYEAYAQSLRDAGLGETALGRDWLSAGERALGAPVPVTLPYREVGYLDPAEASAVAYRFDLARGERLRIAVQPEDPERLLLFVDLFEVPADTTRAARRVASADSTLQMDLEARRSGTYLLRVQPELLRGGRYTVTVQAEASLLFPVASIDSRAIRSFFGDPRDGGRRDHHGVDIFAPRGTPVVASADGVVSRVRNGGLGGKVVWVRDRQRGQSYYYAHLDSQLVAANTSVRAGDTLGLVGNTGNARTTPPHLHFGIYSRGPVDPFPFIHTPPQEPLPLVADTSHLGAWVRIAQQEVPLHARPAERADVLRRLPRHTLLRVLSGSATWYRVHLPDGLSGFVEARHIAPADQPLRTTRLAAGTAMRQHPAPTSPALDSVAAGAQVAVLGRYDDFLYVTSPRDRTGWVTID